MKITRNVGPLSGYSNRLLGGSQVLDTADKRSRFVASIQAELKTDDEVAIYSTANTELQGKGINFLVVCRGVVVSVDSNDERFKTMSRTAQVYTSQADAEENFFISSRQVAGLIRENLSYCPGLTVNPETLIRA